MKQIVKANSKTKATTNMDTGGLVSSGVARRQASSGVKVCCLERKQVVDLRTWYMLCVHAICECMSAEPNVEFPRIQGK